jgi:hypothetical protein
VVVETVDPRQGSSSDFSPYISMPLRPLSTHRRLNFRTLLMDELNMEPWEREGYDEAEEANMEKTESLVHLDKFEARPEFQEKGAVKRVRKIHRSSRPRAWWNLRRGLVAW